MIFKEINKDPNLYCNSCFSRVAKVTVRFGTVNNAIAVRLCEECYNKFLPFSKEDLEDLSDAVNCYFMCDFGTNDVEADRRACEQRQRMVVLSQRLKEVSHEVL